jgi:hypothetical protein
MLTLMLALSKKCTTHIDSPIQYLYQKRIKIGECVLIILISTKLTKKIRLALNQSRPDSMIGCSILNFLDCYSRYHQIPLKIEEQIKTSFITPFSTFCYATMAVGLKSAGATYQRGTQKCLHSQLGRNTEANIDDVVVKIQEDEGLIFDLAETFNNLRKIKMKLNPKKCTFDMPSEKLLGYMIFRWGIGPNPKMVSAITRIAPPQSLHDVQKLMGCMAASSRFISQLSVKGLPFFKLLKNRTSFNRPRKHKRISRTSRST